MSSQERMSSYASEIESLKEENKSLKAEINQLQPSKIKGAPINPAPSRGEKAFVGRKVSVVDSSTKVDFKQSVDFKALLQTARSHSPYPLALVDEKSTETPTMVETCSASNPVLFEEWDRTQFYSENSCSRFSMGIWQKKATSSDHVANMDQTTVPLEQESKKEEAAITISPVKIRFDNTQAAEEVIQALNALPKGVHKLVDYCLLRRARSPIEIATELAKKISLAFLKQDKSNTKSEVIVHKKAIKTTEEKKKLKESASDNCVLQFSLTKKLVKALSTVMGVRSCESRDVLLSILSASLMLIVFQLQILILDNTSQQASGITSASQQLSSHSSKLYTKLLSTFQALRVGLLSPLISYKDCENLLQHMELLGKPNSVPQATRNNNNNNNNNNNSNNDGGSSTATGGRSSPRYFSFEQSSLTKSSSSAVLASSSSSASAATTNSPAFSPELLPPKSVFVFEKILDRFEKVEMLEAFVVRIRTDLDLVESSDTENEDDVLDLQPMLKKQKVAASATAATVESSVVSFGGNKENLEPAPRNVTSNPNNSNNDNESASCSAAVSTDVVGLNKSIPIVVTASAATTTRSNPLLADSRSKQAIPYHRPGMGLKRQISIGKGQQGMPVVFHGPIVLKPLAPGGVKGGKGTAAVVPPSAFSVAETVPMRVNDRHSNSKSQSDPEMEALRNELIQIRSQAIGNTTSASTNSFIGSNNNNDNNNNNSTSMSSNSNNSNSRSDLNFSNSSTCVNLFNTTKTTAKTSNCSLIKPFSRNTSVSSVGPWGDFISSTDSFVKRIN